MKNSKELILGQVVNISIIYRISDSWLNSLNGYDFEFWSRLVKTENMIYAIPDRPDLPTDQGGNEGGWHDQSC